MDDPPCTRMSFADHLSATGIHPWVSDVAAMALGAGRALDSAILDRLEKAFEDYVGGDLSLESLSDVVALQGYFINMRGDFFVVNTSGGPVNVLRNVPAGNMEGRTLVFGEWNTERRGDVELVPFFAAGMFTCLDPGRRGEFRQKRIEYHWPDPDIPGR